MSSVKQAFEALREKIFGLDTARAGALALIHGLKVQVSELAAKNIDLQNRLGEAIDKLADCGGDIDVSELEELCKALDAGSAALQDLNDGLSGDHAEGLADAVAAVPEPAPAQASEAAPAPAAEEAPPEAFEAEAAEAGALEA